MHACARLHDTANFLLRHGNKSPLVVVVVAAVSRSRRRCRHPRRCRAVVLAVVPLSSTCCRRFGRPFRRRCRSCRCEDITVITAAFGSNVAYERFLPSCNGNLRCRGVISSVVAESPPLLRCL